jgi:hypothetical protein
VARQGEPRQRFLFNSHGPDGLGYAHANLSFTNIYTNAANDNTVTEVGRRRYAGL